MRVPKLQFLPILLSPPLAIGQQITESISNPVQHHLQSQADTWTVILMCLFAMVMYFLPLIIAKQRDAKAHNGILVLNLFLGWTVLGWIIALIWAYSGETEAEARAKIVDYNQLAAAMRAQNTK